LENKFLKRQYPANIVKKQIDKVRNLNRQDTLVYKTTEDKKQDFAAFTNNKPFLPLILTYNHKFNIQKSLLNKLKNLWESNILQSAELSTTFLNTFPKIVYKRGKTISNKLITTKCDSNNSTNFDSLDKRNIQILTELLYANSTA